MLRTFDDIGAHTRPVLVDGWNAPRPPLPSQALGAADWEAYEAIRRDFFSPSPLLSLMRDNVTRR